MYYLKKRLEISAAHKLNLSYGSKCGNLHGHNWIVDIHLKSETLNADGMVADFSRIKGLIHDRLDHGNLNDILPFNPTAENIAKWIVDTVPHCYRATVIESENNEASYEI